MRLSDHWVMSHLSIILLCAHLSGNQPSTGALAARAGPSAACLRSCCRWDTAFPRGLAAPGGACDPAAPSCSSRPVGLTWRGCGGRRPMRAAGVGGRCPCAATTGCPGPGQGDEPPAGHLVLGLPGVAVDPRPPAALVVAGDAVGVERVSDVLAGQVLAAHDAGAGLLGDLPDQRLLDRFAVLDGAAREGPLPTVHGDHHHQAVGGEAQPECLGDQLRRWHPSGCHQGEPAGAVPPRWGTPIRSGPVGRPVPAMACSGRVFAMGRRHPRMVWSPSAAFMVKLCRTRQRWRPVPSWSSC